MDELDSLSIEEIYKLVSDEIDDLYDRRGFTDQQIADLISKNGTTISRSAVNGIRNFRHKEGQYCDPKKRPFYTEILHSLYCAGQLRAFFKEHYEIHIEFLSFPICDLNQQFLDDFCCLIDIDQRLKAWARNGMEEYWKKEVLPFIRINFRAESKYIPVMALKVTFWSFQQSKLDEETLYEIRNVTLDCIKWTEEKWDEGIIPPPTKKNKKLLKTAFPLFENGQAAILSTILNNLALLLYYNLYKEGDQELLKEIKDFLNQALDYYMFPGVIATIMTTANDLGDLNWGKEAWNKFVEERDGEIPALLKKEYIDSGKWNRFKEISLFEN